MFDSFSVDLTPSKARIILKRAAFLKMDISSCEEALVELSKKDLAKIDFEITDKDLVQRIIDHECRGIIKKRPSYEILESIVVAAKCCNVNKIILESFQGVNIPSKMHGIDIDSKFYHHHITPEMWQDRDKIMYVVGVSTRLQKWNSKHLMISELPKVIYVGNEVHMEFMGLLALAFYKDYSECYSI